MRHHASLDGLRGLAVILVVLFHAGCLMPGWMGVQLFFVLSGFLITQGLLETRGMPWQRFFSRFYWRRSLRIFPLNYAVILGAAVSYAIWQVPAGFGHSWPYLVTYTTNFLRMMPQEVADGFVHFWSLAVEEQFYLVWPLVVFLLPGRRFAGVVVATILAGPAIRWILGAMATNAGYVGLDLGKLIYLNPLSHLDAFAMGAALAVFPALRSWGTRPVLAGGVAVCGILGAANIVVQHLQGGVAWQSFGYQMYMPNNLQYVWGYTLLNVMGGIAVAYCLHPLSPKGFLEWRWLMYLGKISYGIYIFHYPLLYVKTWCFGEPEGVVASLGAFAAYGLLSVAVASVSFAWFETPLLKLKDRYFN